MQRLPTSAGSLAEERPFVGAARVATGRARRRPSVDSQRAYGFVLPLVLVEVVFVAVPLAIGLYYSFYRVDYFELTEFRGLGNYVRVLTSPMVLSAFLATAVFSVASLVLGPAREWLG